MNGSRTVRATAGGAAQAHAPPNVDAATAPTVTPPPCSRTCRRVRPGRPPNSPFSLKSAPQGRDRVHRGRGPCGSPVLLGVGVMRTRGRTGQERVNVAWPSLDPGRRIGPDEAAVRRLLVGCAARGDFPAVDPARNRATGSRPTAGRHRPGDAVSSPAAHSGAPHAAVDRGGTGPGRARNRCWRSGGAQAWFHVVEAHGAIRGPGASLDHPGSRVVSGARRRGRRPPSRIWQSTCWNRPARSWSSGERG